MYPLIHHISALCPLGFHTSGELWDWQPSFFLSFAHGRLRPALHFYFFETVILLHFSPKKQVMAAAKKSKYLSEKYWNHELPPNHGE